MLLNKNLALGYVAAKDSVLQLIELQNLFSPTPAHDISLLTNILAQIECRLPLLSKTEVYPEP